MGGSIFAVIAIWGFITGKALPVNIAYLALGVTFLLASFLAWRKEVHEGIRLRGLLMPLSSLATPNSRIGFSSMKIHPS